MLSSLLYLLTVNVGLETDNAAWNGAASTVNGGLGTDNHVASSRFSNGSAKNRASSTVIGAL